MSRTLTLKLNDETYQAIQGAAQSTGRTPVEWTAESLNRLLAPVGTAANEAGWHEGFFAETFGSCQNDSIERGRQGDHDLREPLQ